MRNRRLKKKHTPIDTSMLPYGKPVRILGFENYWVYPDGRIWSDNFGGGFMSPRLESNGYYRVNLRVGGKIKRKSVHRLVAIHFVDGYEPRKQVNHIDGNKENNHFLNLEWVTAKENKAHSITVLKKHSRGSRNGSAKLDENKVRLIREMLKAGISKRKTAYAFGVSRRAVLRIEDGETWKHM